MTLCSHLLLGLVILWADVPLPCFPAAVQVVEDKAFCNQNYPGY
ncbi:hypothetical protein CIT292_07250 [Citrobacter youngae ATCC 29220]|uniref:Uncharacterized protein n=1 Tax=Citrobacter youngae ATCC 29220 TaxID=500640 RepID=D4B9W1_9ENTR|nr:hypothetical protein CIT292_07250 [Citrobacter youngae ATCC 29220]